MSDSDRLVPLAVEGAVSTWPGIGALLAPFAGPLAKAVMDEHRRRHSVAIKAAEKASNMQREDLEEVLAADPRLVDLTIALLYAAGMHGHDDTLEMLGRVLGRAAAKPEVTDVARDCLEALRGLREGHLWVLAFAAEHAQQAKGRDDEGQPGENDGRWTTALAAEGTGLAPELVSGYIAGLVASGLVTNPALLMFPGASRLDYIITDFGRLVVDLADLRRQNIK